MSFISHPLGYLRFSSDFFNEGAEPLSEIMDSATLHLRSSVNAATSRCLTWSMVLEIASDKSILLAARKQSKVKDNISQDRKLIHLD
jgi:hypothetical protein